MQFRSVQVLAAVVLASSAAAASIPVGASSAELLVRSDAQSRAGSIVVDARAVDTSALEQTANTAIGKLQADYKLLKSLHAQGLLTQDAEAPIFADIQTQVGTAAEAIKAALRARKAAGSKRAVVKPTLDELVADLEAILDQTYTLLKNLAANLTQTPQTDDKFLSRLITYLDTAITDLAQSLLELAPLLGRLLDPLLGVVGGGLGALGLRSEA